MTKDTFEPFAVWDNTMLWQDIKIVPPLGFVCPPHNHTAGCGRTVQYLIPVGRP